MQRSENHPAGRRLGSAAASRSPGVPDRRRPTVARFLFQPDPRHLRRLLAEVDVGLGSSDPLLSRNVRLLVGEIVARMVTASPRTAVELELEIKADSVRVDISQRGDEDCDFWDRLDDALFSDLTSAWGRDRRGSGGAWFEIEKPAPRRGKAAKLRRPRPRQAQRDAF
jgi:hypothetical protein